MNRSVRQTHNGNGKNTNGHLNTREAGKWCPRCPCLRRLVLRERSTVLTHPTSSGVFSTPTDQILCLPTGSTSCVHFSQRSPREHHAYSGQFRGYRVTHSWAVGMDKTEILKCTKPGFTGHQLGVESNPARGQLNGNFLFISCSFPRLSMASWKGSASPSLLRHQSRTAYEQD